MSSQLEFSQFVTHPAFLVPTIVAVLSIALVLIFVTLSLTYIFILKRQITYLQNHPLLVNERSFLKEFIPVRDPSKSELLFNNLYVEPYSEPEHFLDKRDEPSDDDEKATAITPLLPEDFGIDYMEEAFLQPPTHLVERPPSVPSAPPLKETVALRTQYLTPELEFMNQLEQSIKVLSEAL